MQPKPIVWRLWLRLPPWPGVFPTPPCGRHSPFASEASGRAARPGLRLGRRGRRRAGQSRTQLPPGSIYKSSNVSMRRNARGPPEWRARRRGRSHLRKNSARWRAALPGKRRRQGMSARTGRVAKIAAAKLRLTAEQLSRGVTEVTGMHQFLAKPALVHRILIFNRAGRGQLLRGSRLGRGCASERWTWVWTARLCRKKASNARTVTHRWRGRSGVWHVPGAS